MQFSSQSPNQLPNIGMSYLHYNCQHDKENNTWKHNIHVNMLNDSNNQVSKINKYHNHTPQTNSWHHEEVTQNTDCQKASARKSSKATSFFFHQDDDKTRRKHSTE